jgi:hypothetical protein
MIKTNLNPNYWDRNRLKYKKNKDQFTKRKNLLSLRSLNKQNKVRCKLVDRNLVLILLMTLVK